MVKGNRIHIVSELILCAMILNISTFYTPFPETVGAQEEYSRTFPSPAVTTISSVTNNFINGTGTARQITIQNETVAYFKNASGYLVYPVSNSPNSATVATKQLPAVIMIHDK
jgi:hypothetical protein